MNINDLFGVSKVNLPFQDSLLKCFDSQYACFDSQSSNSLEWYFNKKKTKMPKKDFFSAVHIAVDMVAIKHSDNEIQALLLAGWLLSAAGC